MAKIALPIYYKDANGNRQTRCVANAWTWQDNAMGERYLTLTINSDKPVFFAVGDYCEYRGETYTLNYIPSETQSAKMGRHGTGFTYENIKFDSVLEELTRCAMLDITPTTGDYIAYEGTNYTGSAVFTLFCGSATVTIQGVTKTLTPVTVLAGKIQANLDRMFPSAGWQVIVDYEHTHTDEFLLSFDNWTASQALSEVYNTFKLNYIVKGRQIRIGFDADNVTGDEMFAFGFGKGYNTEGDDGKGLFEIQKMSDSSQKIVTRLRALGSTKNMPYRYYNKKYNLPQAMFPLNLQLPDTFETPEVKAAHNAQRESSLRHVLGDTNDAYIDKNDNAAECVEGVREDVARWDGSDSNLKEIFPTIKEGTYRDLKNALVPDAQGRTAGSSYYNGYGDTERIDEVLAVGYGDGGIWIDDANIGDGIVTEPNVSGKTIDSPTIEQNTTVVRNTSLESRGGKLYGAEIPLWSIDAQSAGAYILVGNNNLYFRAGSYISGSSSAILRAGFIIRIKINDGSSVTTLTYESAATDVPNGGSVDIPFPRLPDVENVDNTQISRIALASTSDVSVTFTPYWVNDASLPSNFEVSYKWGKGEGTTTDAHLVWSPDDSTFGTVNQQFHIYVKDLGFNINDYKSGEAPNVVMAGGVCVSRSFEITDVKLVSYRRGGKTLDAYCLTLNRATDDTIHAYFPSQYYPIQAGDNFVLEGIEMPDVYVQLAELRLLRAATDYLADNCDTSFIYKPTISNIYLQWNYDKMLAAGTPEKSIYWRLYAGLKFTFRGIPESLNPTAPLPIAEITIESVTIREGEGKNPIPQVEITLNNNIQQNTIQKLTTTVDRIYSAMANGTGGTGAAATNSMLLNLLRTEGGKLFLSKTSDDTASGVISFLRGALFGEGSAWGYVRQVAGEVRSWFKNLATDILTVTGHVKGNNGTLNVYDNIYSTGSGEFDGDLSVVDGSVNAAKIIANDGNFSDTVTTKNLRVTGSAYFWELIIDKIRAAGGSWLITPADGFVVEAVEERDDRWRLLWKASDGEKWRRSMWATGMQAICRTMNATTGYNHNLSNKYYWALVVAASTDSGAQPGKIGDDDAHWIEISKTDKDGGSEPEVGDEVAQLGFRKSGTLSDDDKAKQGAIYIASYQSIDSSVKAPVIAIYEGIDSFSLSGKRVSTISPKEVAFYATKFKIITGNNTQTIADYVDAKILVSAEGILSVVNSLPISRNLLLNTDFKTTVESGNGAMHIVPNIRYQGYRQQSKDANGNWVAKLTKNKHYVLSFYAKGTGKVSALVNRVNVNNGTSAYAVDGVFDLTSYWKRYKVEFDVPNTTVVLAYDVMLGYHDNTGGEVSDIDIQIARPQLEQSDSMTEWSGTDAKNILVNSALVDVNGIIPRGWQAWDDGGVPTLREIVPEMVLAYWDEWNNGQAQYDVATHRVTGEKWKSLEIKPTAQFQGVAQVSSALSGGRWEKVLRHGGTYTLSFFACGTGRADCIVHLMKVSPDGSAEYISDTWIGNEFSLGNEWKRFSIVFNALPTNGSDYDTDGYAFHVRLGCYHENPPLNEDIFISRPQLEEGAKATVWRMGEENSEVMSSQIRQTADEISLAVKVDGVKRAGVTLDGNGVTIDGDKLHFNGTINDEVTIEGANLHILNDIDLQGLTTENVRIVRRSVDGGGRDITVVNMGVGVTGDEVVKSVQVKGNSRNGDDGQYADYNPHIVVLPFYDDIVTSGNQADNTYWPTKNTDITFDRTDGSFLLSGDEGIPLSQRKVVEWRKNGTRVTVTNEVINKFRNWKSIEGEVNADYREADANSLGGFVVVCADGRVLADANIKSALNQFNPSGYSGDSEGFLQNILHGGCFSCMGYMARFIILLPGQSLQLRSQIVTIGTYTAYDAQTDTVATRERKVLTWVVENPMEFVPFAPGSGGIDFNIQGSPQQGNHSLEYVSGLASYNRTDSYHSWYETILAPAVMNLRTDKTIEIWL